MRNSLCLVGVLFFSTIIYSSLANAQLAIPTQENYNNQYESIDSYALATTKDREVNLNILVKHLITPAKNDEEKIRAIFSWIKDRISYDQKGFESKDKRRKIITAEEAFKKRQAVCLGFANLFVVMAERARFEAKLVTGVTPEYFTTRGSEKEKKLHAWNAVKIDKKWHLLDVTWGLWFTPPEEMIFTHLPDDSENQFLRRPVSVNDFKYNKIDASKLEPKYKD